jgi:DNA polymerase-3 subunit delta'
MSFVPFPEIIGQEKALRFLKKALAREKLSHAYLFVGVPGIGKTTTAIALARAINCLEERRDDGCGRCTTCRQFAAGTFVDLQIVRPEGHVIKIEQIREIDRFMSFKAFSGRYRVVVLKQAETMSPEAANAFLKTLEEPPPGNLLILNVAEPLNLLPTILSRCQQVLFNPVPAPLISRWLAEKHGVDQERADLLAKLSDGSFGKALSMEQGGFLEKRHKYIDHLMSLREISEPEVLELALQYTGKERKKDQEERKGGKREKDEILILISVWKSWYRDILLAKYDGSPALLINQDLLSELKKVSRDFTIENMVTSLLALDRAESDFHHSRNLDLMMETLMLSLRKLAVGRGTGNEFRAK